MQFITVAQCLEKIEAESSRLAMTELLSRLFSKCSKRNIGKVILFLQAQLAPAFKSIALGIGDKIIIQSIALSTGYSVKNVETKFNKTGDLGLVAEYLIKNRKQQPLTSKKLKLSDVYNSFLKIAQSSGTGSQARKIRYLSELFNSAEPVEARYIARFSQGDLRVGIGDPTIIDALSYMFSGNKSMRNTIERAYNLRSDLSMIATIVFENPDNLKKIKPQLFYPIRPALAERMASAEQIFEKLGACYVENKYDGLRLQIHKKADKVEIYSRRLENLTYMFPDIVAEAKKLKQKQLIIEGEAIGYDKENKKFYAFQFTIQRKRKYDIDKLKKIIPLHVYVFDVLYAGKQSLVEKSYEQRRKKLLKIIPKKNSLFKISKAIFAQNPEQIQECFDNSVSSGLEGVMVKDQSKHYTAGARKFAWVKLKRSFSGLMDTVDAVVLGYYLGKGKRAQFEFGGLLAGTYNAQKNVFETIARIGTGFTEEDMKNYKKMFEKIKLKAKPYNVDSKIKPDFWVLPKYVIEVDADEITVSPMHTCAKDHFKEQKGLALRFPRHLKLRVTKGARDATTSKEVFDMYYRKK